MKNQATQYLKKIYEKILEHRIISFVIFCVVVSVFYYFIFNTAVSTVTYQYTAVKRGSLVSTVSATGLVTPNSQVELKPKVNANVTGVYVRAGDRVTEGKVLFRLDATEAYKQVRDAKTSLGVAELALEKLRNPKTIDIMSLENSLKQEEDNKLNENIKVETAFRNLLNGGIQAIPDGAYTEETSPTITGSYTKNKEGQIKVVVYQGGESGYSFSLSGLVSATGNINTSVAQPLGDTGLYIKWNGTNPRTNWLIDIPNKQAASYSSNYTAWQNAITNRDSAHAASDRTILSLKQKLDDLTPSDDNLDIKSALLTILQRKNSLLDAQQTLSNYTLTAPFDGVMASVSVDIGSSAVMASSNSSAALGTIVTDKKLAQITLNEADVVKIKIGQKATITFDAIEGLRLEGTIVEINTLGTVTSGVVTYKVKVAFGTDDIRILPNMSVSVDILVDSKENVLYLPDQAVKHDTDGYYVEKENVREVVSDTSLAAQKLNSTTSSSMNRFSSSTASPTRKSFNRNVAPTPNTGGSVSRIIRIPVTIGLQNDTLTEITSGLSEGEMVITKKITTTQASNGAPSVTSLLRPQGQTRSASVKPQ